MYARTQKQEEFSFVGWSYILTLSFLDRQTYVGIPSVSLITVTVRLISGTLERPPIKCKTGGRKLRSPPTVIAWIVRPMNALQLCR